MPHEFVGSAIDDFVIGLNLDALGVEFAKVGARPDVEGKRVDDHNDAEELNEEAPTGSRAKTQLRNENGLQDQNGDEEEDEKCKIPGAARAAGGALFVVAADE
jgi:hypothetical protein